MGKNASPTRDGLLTSFTLLAETENEAAIDVLIAALDSPRRVIQESALRALLDRRSLAGQREILRRMHTLDAGWKAILRERPGRLSQGLREGLLSSDPGLFANACQAVKLFAEYDQIPTLVNVAEDRNHPNSDLATTTLLETVQLLYEELAAPRDYRTRRDPQLVRRNISGSLEASVGRYVKHKRTELLEAFLLIAGRDNATFTQILLDPHHSCYVSLVQAITHSPRAGVMRLVLGYLDDPHSPTALMTVIGHRSDRKFVEHVLRKIGHEPSAAAKQNLKHIECIAWVRDDAAWIDELDDAAQHSAVQLVTASGMPGVQVYKFIERMARRGKPGGRRAAIAALHRFPGADGNQLVLDAINDSDPQVQAVALAQLRPRGIATALATLIQHVDSPYPIVRQAARDSLAEFNFKRFVQAFDMLEDEVRQSTGALVKRVDRHALAQLREELTAAAGKRRMRGLQIAVAMNAVPEVEDTMLEMLDDDDHLVRAATATALAVATSEAAEAALQRALSDSSFAVQEAARASLKQIRTRPATPKHTPPDRPPAGEGAKSS